MVSCSSPSSSLRPRLQSPTALAGLLQYQRYHRADFDCPSRAVGFWGTQFSISLPLLSWASPAGCCACGSVCAWPCTFSRRSVAGFPGCARPRASPRLLVRNVAAGSAALASRARPSAPRLLRARAAVPPARRSAGAGNAGAVRERTRSERGGAGGERRAVSARPGARVQGHRLFLFWVFSLPRPEKRRFTETWQSFSWSYPWLAFLLCVL